MENLIEDCWSCYILKSQNPLYPNRTYVGSTNSVKRRIRQHNGILVGGAKATNMMRPNEFYCVITGFPDKISALKCEWLLKHPTGTRKGNSKYSGILGRIKGLNYLITHSDKWKTRSKECPLKIWISTDLIAHLDSSSFPESIEILSC
ncbi:GIY-YIG nuclease [Catovirus CTV1]|uniref:GIY-YIG nuclease n=1 Tax=Catovirus CTV1 TaxID=1977631 RepID=A0A1V0SAI0_9VIRU|nr:GIY-YIG nuclease [Catovirus CTV1]